MGLTGIGEDEIVLRAQQDRWQQAVQAYNVCIQESYTEEQSISTSPQCGSRCLDESQRRPPQPFCHAEPNFEDPQHFRGALPSLWAGRRSKIATILLAIMQALNAGRESEKVRILLPSSVGQ
jgi:hypothetical protein